jgi:hypothetical protein
VHVQRKTTRLLGFAFDRTGTRMTTPASNENCQLYQFFGRPEAVGQPYEPATFQDQMRSSQRGIGESDFERLVRGKN